MIAYMTVSYTPAHTHITSISFLFIEYKITMYVWIDLCVYIHTKQKHTFNNDSS